MPLFRIHRMKETPRQQFRWAPHTSGAIDIKPRDYQPGGEVQAANLYDAWMSLRGTAAALDIGDLLETPSGELRIFKYVGFEEARWLPPEARSGLEVSPAAAGQAAPPA